MENQNPFFDLPVNIADRLNEPIFLQDDDTGDIGPLMESFGLAVRTNTPFKEPVTKVVPLSKADVAGPVVIGNTWTPEITLTPRAGSPLAKDSLIKRAGFSDKRATRTETIPANTATGGYWIRHFDENDSLFRCYFSADGVNQDAEVVL